MDAVQYGLREPCSRLRERQPCCRLRASAARANGRLKHGFSSPKYVAAEVADGRVFTAYYYMLADGIPHGGSRFIAGSCFDL